MSKIFIVKSATGFLLPADAKAEEVVNKWKVGAKYSLTCAPARSPEQHRMAFALATTVCNNAPEGSYWHDKDAYHFIKAVELEIGMVEETANLHGEITLSPKSIAFENMPGNEFKVIFDALVREGSRILGCTERELLEGMEAA